MWKYSFYLYDLFFLFFINLKKFSIETYTITYLLIKIINIQSKIVLRAEELIIDSVLQFSKLELAY